VGSECGGVEPVRDAHDTLSITCVLDAPRDLVWQAWIDPELLSGWWWPPRFGTEYEIDLHIGGRYRFRSIDLPEIGVLGLFGTYLEVRAPDRLAYTWEWDGGDEPATTVTLEFVARASQTEIHIRHEGFRTEHQRENHIQGWTDCLNRLRDLWKDDRSPDDRRGWAENQRVGE
jgi:uncharacterized protein YndB with AHSA1/START domain